MGTREGRSTGSRELGWPTPLLHEASAYYTSMRPSAHQRETVVGLDRHQDRLVADDRQPREKKKITVQLCSAAHCKPHH